MTPTLYFLAGFATGIIPLATLIIAYYLRARRRLRAVRQTVQNLRASDALVSEAIQRVYHPRT